MANRLYPVIVFYISFIVLLSLFGLTTEEGEALLEFPSWPDVPTPESIIGVNALFAVGALIIEFFLFLFILFRFVIQLVVFTGAGLLPTWLNIIIFLPLAIILVYEGAARLIRGSGGG